MLTEARVDSDQIRDLVFGLGLNVNSPANGWPGELGGRAISLSELTGARLDFNRLTAALAGRVLLAYERFVSGEYRSTLMEMWRRYDVLSGRRITVLEGGRRQGGTMMGVDEEGALVLRDDRGRQQCFGPAR